MEIYDEVEDFDERLTAAVLRHGFAAGELSLTRRDMLWFMRRLMGDDMYGRWCGEAYHWLSTKDGEIAGHVAGRIAIRILADASGGPSK